MCTPTQLLAMIFRHKVLVNTQTFKSRFIKLLPDLWCLPVLNGWICVCFIITHSKDIYDQATMGESSIYKNLLNHYITKQNRKRLNYGAALGSEIHSIKVAFVLSWSNILLPTLFSSHVIFYAAQTHFWHITHDKIKWMLSWILSVSVLKC